MLLSHPQRHHIGDRSLSLCNMFLDEMAKQARNLITDICTEQCTLSDQVHTQEAFEEGFLFIILMDLLSYMYFKKSVLLGLCLTALKLNVSFLVSAATLHRKFLHLLLRNPGENQYNRHMVAICNNGSVLINKGGGWSVLTLTISCLIAVAR